MNPSFANLATRCGWHFTFSFYKIRNFKNIGHYNDCPVAIINGFGNSISISILEKSISEQLDVGVGWRVAGKILGTAQSPNPFFFFGFDSLELGLWIRACQYIQMFCGQLRSLLRKVITNKITAWTRYTWGTHHGRLGRAVDWENGNWDVEWFWWCSCWGSVKSY